MHGEVTHPPGTTYLIITVPPDITDADRHVIRQGVRDALKDAHRQISGVALFEERTVVGPNGQLD